MSETNSHGPDVKLPWELTPEEAEAARRIAAGYIEFTRSQTDFSDPPTTPVGFGKLADSDPDQPFLDQCPD